MKEVIKILRQLLKKLGLNAVIENQGNLINISVSSPGLLIGANGQNISYLEILVKRIVFKQQENPEEFKLDINEYRHKKNLFLKRLAQDNAYRAKLTKQPVKLKPMSAYERRIIHLELENKKEVITTSYGEGDERCIVISPA